MHWAQPDSPRLEFWRSCVSHLVKQQKKHRTPYDLYPSLYKEFGESLIQPNKQSGISTSALYFMFLRVKI